MTTRLDWMCAHLLTAHADAIANAVAATDSEVVMMPLTGFPDGSTPEQIERWERTCDVCGTYCPDPVPFYTGARGVPWRGVRVEITFGLCAGCAPMVKAGQS